MPPPHECCPPALHCTALLPAVLQGEQEEYAEEGISWSFIDYVDNQDCLDL
jgi:hypothetical protein